MNEMRKGKEPINSIPQTEAACHEQRLLQMAMMMMMIAQNNIILALAKTTKAKNVHTSSL